MTWEPEIEEIQRRKELAYRMGGEEGIRRQHDNGKLTVRERIEGLVDPGTFRELGVMAGRATYEDGNLADFTPANHVSGRAKINGRWVMLAGGDFTVRGGAADGGVGNKGGYAEKFALDYKIPMVRLVDATGGSVRSIENIGRTYVPANPNWDIATELIGKVPVVAAALGSVAGLPAAQVAASHFSVMVRGTSQVFAAGPPVVVRALGVDMDKDDLGGAAVHARHSGLVDNEAADEHDAFRQVRAFLSYLPDNAWQMPPACSSDDPVDRREEALLSLIPRDRNKPYDPRKLLALVLDRGSVFEVGRYFGRSQVTAFGRLAGYPVGVLANDPIQHGGAMDADAADKMTRFVDICNTFNLPVVNLVDQPGFMVGLKAEQAGTLRHGVRALSALYQAVIPWATVIVRRVYGVAGAGHQNHARSNLRVAWPSGEWGSLPIAGGVMAAYRRQIEAAEDPEAYRKEIEARLEAMQSPFRTAEAFNIEDILDPRDTRPLLCEWVEMAYRLLPTMLGPKLQWMRP